MVNQAQRVEEAINLRKQIAGLGHVEDADLVFQDTSPRRHWEPVYNMATGERHLVPSHRLETVLSKILPDGSPAFTARQELAPAYVLGEVKCFLARDSKEREVVDELNISPGYYCPAEHLANEMAAITHAEHRHPGRWKAYSAHLERVERDAWREEQRIQMQAMMQLANAVAPAKFLCSTCGFEAASAAGLAAHERSH